MLLLIIDDDLEDLELFDEAIHEIDPSIKLKPMRDGKEAIQLLSKDPGELPDYIFLDINMPVMNGSECLAALKKHPKLRDIPVIMYSTTSDKSEIDGYYKLGASDFLIKPHNFKKLVKALTAIITSKKELKH